MASIKKRPDGRYRARYECPGCDNPGRRKDPGARHEHASHHARKVDAQRWLDEKTASIVTGQYVAPSAGVITFREYAEHWRVIQAHRPSTADHVRRHFVKHVYPVIGSKPLKAILPSDVKGLVARMGASLAPSTTATVYRYVSAVFKAAVADRRIPRTPCEGVSVRKPARERVTPVETAKVKALLEVMPERFVAMVALAAGTGMRYSEVAGLTMDRVDFLRRRVVVDRQLVAVPGRPVGLGPPKTESSVREIPLPRVVVEALAAHLAAFPAGPDGYVFTMASGRPVRRSDFGDVWRKAVASVGLDGFVFHGLRHYYASLLIRHGESVKTVQERLGHKSATETLDTYSHLWEDSDDRTRDAVDEVLGGSADSVRTTRDPRKRTGTSEP